MTKHFYKAKLYIPLLILLLSSQATAQLKKLEPKDVLSLDFKPKGSLRYKWMKATDYYVVLDSNKIVQRHIARKDVEEELLDGDELDIEIDRMILGPQEERMLLSEGRKKLFRISSNAYWHLYDRATGSLDSIGRGRLSNVAFSPDGSKVAFTSDNDLFYYRIELDSIIPVTSDGQPGRIINGSADWVHEEELRMTKAFSWSPDGQHIAFLRFDEEDVTAFPIQTWDDSNSWLPRTDIIKYPKAGGKNARVEVYIHELKTSRSKKIDLGELESWYIPSLTWTRSANLLSLRFLNRIQTELKLVHYDLSSRELSQVLSFQSEKYIDYDYCRELIYLEDGKHILVSSEQTGSKHFYLYTMDGRLVRAVTSGDFEASSLVAVDQAEGAETLFYLSTEMSPLERNLYQTGLWTGERQRLTTTGVVHGTVFNQDFTKLIIRESRSDRVPRNVLYSREGWKELDVPEANEELEETLSQYDFSQKHFFEVPISQDLSLHGYLLRPAGFDPGNKYPLVLYQYSGPGSQSVFNNWGGSQYIFHQYLAQEGYLVAVVDPRGGGGRGVSFKAESHGRLGEVEVKDQEASIDFLISRGYVDPERIGVWGWSYGGFVSSLLMTSERSLFRVGVAVAPVTSWRFYDTIYTERYMGLPTEDKEGYGLDLMSRADALEGRFLLVHGMADDNVHIQNSVAFQQALVDAGKQFDVLYYPNQAHSLSGVSEHLFIKLAGFFIDNL